VIAYLYHQLGYKKWKKGVAHSKKLAKLFTLDELKKYQNRNALENDVKWRSFILYLHCQVGLDLELSKHLVRDYSKEELENILFGDVVYKTEKTNTHLGKANLTFWKEYMSEGKKYSSENENKKNFSGLVDLSHFFNMFIPTNYVDDPEKLTHAYRLFYRKIMAHPASSSFVRIKNDHFYILNDSRYVNLTETLLSSAGLGGKKRKLPEAKELTLMLNS
jgi:hypothetical protein